MTSTEAPKRRTKADITGNERIKPGPAVPIYANLPEAIKGRKQFVIWRWEWRKKKWDKPPFCAKNGDPNGWNQNPENWATLLEASAGLGRYKASGLGIVATDDGSWLVCGDLDECVDPDTGEILDWPEHIAKLHPNAWQPRQIMAALGGYWETTVSGTGLRFFVFCPGVDKTLMGNWTGAEFYIDNKYLTITGRRVDPITGESCNGPCEPATVDSELLDKVLAMFAKAPKQDSDKPSKKTRSRKPQTVAPDEVTADTVIEMCRKAANAEKFAKLFEGDTSDYGGDQSRADSALCCMLAFYSVGKPELIDAAFRKSKLMRDKWDERHHGDGRTYGAATIDNALEVVTEFYTYRKAVGNVGYREVIDEESGESRTICFALTINEVLETLFKATDNWPRRVDNALFVDEGDGLTWLANTSSLFAWLNHRTGLIDWHKIHGCATREETYEILRQRATQYAAIEQLPHEPRIAGHYYACGEVLSGDGSKLNQLLDRFSYFSDIDRDLTRAAFLTPFWGGPSGMRPAFVVTTPDGPGVGKTTLVNIIGDLAGGLMSFDRGEEVGDIKTRLLSPDALAKRVPLIDNIKSLKFNWGELEGLITAASISGKRMYLGEATRPNTLSWFLTLNGANLSTDMAQRSVIIKLRKPTRSATWDEDVRRFVNENRTALVADIIGALRAPGATLERFTRWAMWERAVLSRLPDPSEAQAVIAERQGTVDAEQEENEVVESYFAQELKRLGYELETARVFIPVQVACQWLGRATNERLSTTAASRHLRRMIGERRFTSIAENASGSYGKGFIWQGERSSGHGTAIDLLARLAREREFREAVRHGSRVSEEMGVSDF